MHSNLSLGFLVVPSKRVIWHDFFIGVIQSNFDGLLWNSKPLVWLFVSLRLAADFFKVRAINTCGRQSFITLEQHVEESLEMHCFVLVAKPKCLSKSTVL